MTWDQKSSSHLSVIEPNPDDDEGEGGQTSAISFQYPDLLAMRRDDLLPDQKKQQLAIYADAHLSLIKKQQNLLAERALEKSQNKTKSSQKYKSKVGSQKSLHIKHPILGNAPQFDGRDSQVRPLADQEIETNLEMKERLENRLQHRLQLSARPKNKPTTPTLRRR